jgi:hypothetical protein
MSSRPPRGASGRTESAQSATLRSEGCNIEDCRRNRVGALARTRRSGLLLDWWRLSMTAAAVLLLGVGDLGMMLRHLLRVELRLGQRGRGAASGNAEYRARQCERCHNTNRASAHPSPIVIPSPACCTRPPAAKSSERRQCSALNAESARRVRIIVNTNPPAHAVCCLGMHEKAPQH